MYPATWTAMSWKPASKLIFHTGVYIAMNLYAGVQVNSHDVVHIAMDMDAGIHKREQLIPKISTDFRYVRQPGCRKGRTYDSKCSINEPRVASSETGLVSDHATPRNNILFRK